MEFELEELRVVPVTLVSFAAVITVVTQRFSSTRHYCHPWSTCSENKIVEGSRGLESSIMSGLFFCFSLPNR